MERPSFRELLGLETRAVRHEERLISALGGFVAITLLYASSHFFLGGHAALLLTASMGASTVLLFAVPHGPLSQPWQVISGHLISALVGVTCAQLLPGPEFAAATAVGIAILAMHYLHCIHPPGGATALVAVMGGPVVHHLGYSFVLTPVALNVCVLVLVAVVFNAPFAWRKYPAAWGRRGLVDARAMYVPIAHEDFVYALSQIDTLVDISEEQLVEIYAMATRHREAITEAASMKG